MTLPLPAYGKALWQKRIAGRHPPVVALLVGNDWKRPRWVIAEIPLLAVKTADWPRGDARLDWRLVAGLTVLAVDMRTHDERANGPGEWDAWFWLLAQARYYAAELWMFTPTIDWPEDPPHGFTPERELTMFAWLYARRDAASRQLTMPPWHIEPRH